MPDVLSVYSGGLLVYTVSEGGRVPWCSAVSVGWSQNGGARLVKGRLWALCQVSELYKFIRLYNNIYIYIYIYSMCIYIYICIHNFTHIYIYNTHLEQLRNVSNIPQNHFPFTNQNSWEHSNLFFVVHRLQVDAWNRQSQMPYRVLPGGCSRVFFCAIEIREAFPGEIPSPLSCTLFFWWDV